jgi:hypothetical protein
VTRALKARLRAATPAPPAIDASLLATYDSITLELERIEWLADLIEDKLVEDDGHYGMAVVADCIKDKSQLVRALARSLYASKTGGAN